jgi:hypothetical protein
MWPHWSEPAQARTVQYGRQRGQVEHGRRGRVRPDEAKDRSERRFAGTAGARPGSNGGEGKGAHLYVHMPLHGLELALLLEHLL